ncbi:hypothetical protein IQ249_12425 [Lusitaniella coriacea LEGE 07157]|uniref:Uncharacterized protein n=1 Tax=Lusitaniella coriacea LEGE 07157 TaxID=945747 RepID=A0A8J7DWW6_9CYAN|nr:hypothetical protein [Lusitaniella coriacea]MBE9116706.1 hypothetical protein [Lusitaniella coriacea LEGE 07157]
MTRHSMHIRNWLKTIEIFTVFGSAIGTIVAAITQEAVYATTPLALAFSLSLFNRQELERRNRRINMDLVQQVQQLSRRIQFIEERLSTHALAPGELNRVTDKIGNHSQEIVNLQQSVSALMMLQNQFSEVNHTVDTLVKQIKDRPELEESYLHDYLIRFKREVENKLIDLDERTEVLLEKQD